MRQLPLWTPIAALMLAYSWVLPNSSLPWTTFHKDAWMAFVLLLVCVPLLFGPARWRIQARLDVLALSFVVMAALAAFQFHLGTIHFHGHAALGIAYCLGAGMAVIVGRGWAQAHPRQMADFLNFAFLWGAMSTTVLMLFQWLQVEVSEVWALPLVPGARPYGNLVQPNNAATLLICGVASLFWYASTKSIRPLVLLFAAAYLVFFVALTGSRIGYLSLTVILLTGLFWRSRLTAFDGLRPVAAFVFVLFVVYVVLLARDWGALAASVGMPGTASQLIDRPLTSSRLQVYEAFSAAALRGPWLGYGFAQGADVQLAAGQLGYSLPTLFRFSHNVYLDIATWFGPIAGIAILLVSVIVTWRIISARLSMEQQCYLMMATPLFLHGMVELPLAYAYFLLPFCLIVGALAAQVRIPAWRLPMPGVAVLYVALASMLVAFSVDYLKIEQGFYAHRFKEANVGAKHVRNVPSAMMLDQLEALLIGFTGEPTKLGDQELVDFERAALLEPSPAAMQRLAEHYALQGRLVDAQRVADMSRALFQESTTFAMDRRWRYLVTLNPNLAGIEWLGDSERAQLPEVIK